MAITAVVSVQYTMIVSASLTLILYNNNNIMCSVIFVLLVLYKYSLLLSFIEDVVVIF